MADESARSALDEVLSGAFGPINRAIGSVGSALSSRPMPKVAPSIETRDPLDRIIAGESADDVYGREPTTFDRIMATPDGQKMMFLAQFLTPGAKGPTPPSPKLKRPKKGEAIKSGRGDEEAMFEGAKAGAHLKRMPEGKYSGAPEHVASPQALASMRKELDRLVREGEAGQGWYDAGRAAVREMTGDQPRANAVTANTIGITSPQATPDQNLGYTMKGLVNHAVTGEVPPVVRFGAMSDAIRDQIKTDGAATKGLGAKTRVFADTLNPDKEGQFHGSTNDIWHARAFGYKSPDGSNYSGTPTKQMHTFMDGETALAAIRAREAGIGHNGGSPISMPNVQERIWIAKKIEDAIANGVPREKAVETILGSTYKDYLDKYSTNATHEFLPGGPTGHLAGLDKAPDLLDKFYASPATTWATAPGGRDAIYASMDLMPVRPTLKMQGAWKDPVKGFQTNPGEVARPMVDLVEGPGKSRVASPTAKSAIEGAEALRAYLSAQSGAATHRTTPGQAGAAGAVHVPMGRPLKADEMKAVAAAAAERGYDVSDTGKGLTITSFSGERGPADLKRDFPGILGDVRRTLPEAGPPERRAIESTYMDMDFSQPGSGTATRQLLDKMDTVPEFGRRAMGNSPQVKERAVAMRDRDAAIGKEGNLPVREDIQRARLIFAEEGLDGLRAALARGEVLPAAAAAILGVGSLGGEEGRP